MEATIITVGSMFPRGLYQSVLPGAGIVWLPDGSEWTKIRKPADLHTTHKPGNTVFLYQ